MLQFFELMFVSCSLFFLFISYLFCHAHYREMFIRTSCILPLQYSHPHIHSSLHIAAFRDVVSGAFIARHGMETETQPKKTANQGFTRGKE